MADNTPRKKITMKDIYANRRQTITSAILEEPPTEDVDITKAYNWSRFTLGDYVTLDWEHREDINHIKSQISDYAKDRTRSRPLNIIMRAEPGSGKSHMVKCLAKNMKSLHATAVDFNMASLQSIEDLIQPLDSVRNIKVVDRLPILFLDEFDSNSANYAMLLPLMWDGELHIGHRDLKLGKLVIILAGSGKNIEKAMKSAKSMLAVFETSGDKLVDLLSRINGGELEIPSLDEFTKDRDRRIDKVCLTASLIQNRFGDKIETIPWALLRFVVMSKFRYGVRSIAHLIDIISPLEDDATTLQLDNLKLPLKNVAMLKNSSLANHIYSEDGPAAIIALWVMCCECDISVRIKEATPAETTD